jgi:hypothetical protein
MFILIVRNREGICAMCARTRSILVDLILFIALFNNHWKGRLFLALI